MQNLLETHCYLKIYFFPLYSYWIQWFDVFYFCEETHHSQNLVFKLILLCKVSIGNFSEGFCVFQDECFVSLTGGDVPKILCNWILYISQEFDHGSS